MQELSPPPLGERGAPMSMARRPGRAWRWAVRRSTSKRCRSWPQPRRISRVSGPNRGKPTARGRCRCLRAFVLHPGITPTWYRPHLGTFPDKGRVILNHSGSLFKGVIPGCNFRVLQWDEKGERGFTTTKHLLQKQKEHTSVGQTGKYHLDNSNLS